MNRRTDAWQNGRFIKMFDHPFHTTPNHHPPKMDVLQKTFLQIILAAKWLVRHSSTSPNQQRRPLPYLLSVSSPLAILLDCFYIVYIVCFSSDGGQAPRGLRMLKERSMGRVTLDPERAAELRDRAKFYMRRWVLKRKGTEPRDFFPYVIVIVGHS